MYLTDLTQEIYTAVTVNKSRSSLTVLGIVIGIASVIVMVAIGQGAQTAIQQNIQAIGSNLLIIRPGSQQGPGSPVQGAQGSAQSLTTDDAVLLGKLPEVAAVASEAQSRGQQVTALGKNTNTSVTGVTSDYPAVRNIKLAEGSFVTEVHERSLAKVAVLGPDVVAELFPTQSPIGKKVRIGKVDFTVIGVMTARGGSGFGSSDDVIYIPVSTAQQFLTGNTYLSNINVQIKLGEDMTAAAASVKAALSEAHGIASNETADFSILNQAEIVATASSVTSTFTTLLGAVAGISLVVGGIGIMNMMLTSVTERTREIGLRKAIGARGKEIRLQFLAEAIVLTFSGGFFGIFWGFVISYVMNRYGIAAEISTNSIALAFLVSAAIGIVFGYYPASRAARLNPIDALRYE
ncbi:MAG: ABC transporter permease [Candidatus Moraniibacteriota bacterium]